MMRSVNWISAKSLSVEHKAEIWLRSNVESQNEYPPTHCFCCHPVMFLLNIFPLKLFIFN